MDIYRSTEKCYNSMKGGQKNRTGEADVYVKDLTFLASHQKAVQVWPTFMIYSNMETIVESRKKVKSERRLS
ncbi:MAG TPA: hypothetical protein DD632_07230 [Oribacterium sp.]|nr:hypothetical protein [Oribacterium sp.]